MKALLLFTDAKHVNLFNHKLHFMKTPIQTNQTQKVNSIFYSQQKNQYQVKATTASERTAKLVRLTKITFY